MHPTRRVLAAVAVAVLIAAGAALAALRLTADDGPSRADIVAAVRRDPRTSGVPDAAAECLADWYLAYASPEQVEALLEARPAPPGAPTDEAEAAVLECLKKAA
jgi:hypothetical protein